MTLHKNFLLPLDQPHDLKPIIPRSWKLESSSSSPTLARLSHVRVHGRQPRSRGRDAAFSGSYSFEDDDNDDQGSPLPAKAPAPTVAEVQAHRMAEEDAVAAVSSRSILAELSSVSSVASLPPAPRGASGVPSSVPLAKVWSWSVTDRRPPPMLVAHERGLIKRFGE